MLGLRGGWGRGGGLCDVWTCQKLLSCYGTLREPTMPTAHWLLYNAMRFQFPRVFRMSYTFDLRNRTEIYWVKFKILYIFYWIFSHFCRRHSPKGRQNSYVRFFLLLQNSLAPRSCSSCTPLPTDSSKFYSLRGGLEGKRLFVRVFWISCNLLWKRRTQIQLETNLSSFWMLLLAHSPQLAKQMCYSNVLVELFQVEIS